MINVSKCRKKSRHHEALSLWAIAASLVVRNQSKNGGERQDLLFYFPHVLLLLRVKKRVLLTHLCGFKTNILTLMEIF